MKPAVIELQEMAMDSNTDLTACLRRALAISSKLNLTGFKLWASLELDGYQQSKNKDIPDYRIIGSSLVAKNPYRGYIPFVIDDSKMMKDLTIIYVREPVRSLVHLLENTNGNLEFNVTPEVQSYLMKLQGDLPMEVTRKIAPSSIEAIIDRVRTQLLNFSLELENNGILGDGISFSASEKERANAMPPSINIGVFQGVLGDISNSSVQQNSFSVIEKGNFSSLERQLTQLGIASKDIDDLKEAIQVDNLSEKASSFGNRVSSWLGRMMTKAASGVWDVGIGAAGNLLGDALKQFYGF